MKRFAITMLVAMAAGAIIFLVMPPERETVKVYAKQKHKGEVALWPTTGFSWIHNQDSLGVTYPVLRVFFINGPKDFRNIEYAYQKPIE